MKKYFLKNRTDLIIILLFTVFAILSIFTNFEFGLKTISNFKISFLDMIAFIPLIFVLIGLFDVWVPRSVIQKHIGQGSGIKGIFWVILLAMLQAGPLYGAFPVALMLWKKGSSIRNIFIYLGAFSTMKIPMLSFEIGFLGWKFTLLRTILTLPVFIIIAVTMEKIFKNTFTVHEVHNE